MRVLRTYIFLPVVFRSLNGAADITQFPDLTGTYNLERLWVPAILWNHVIKYTAYRRTFFAFYSKILEFLERANWLEISNNIQLLCTMCSVKLFIKTETKDFFNCTSYAFILLHAKCYSGCLHGILVSLWGFLPTPPKTCRWLDLL